MTMTEKKSDGGEEVVPNATANKEASSGATGIGNLRQRVKRLSQLVVNGESEAADGNSSSSGKANTSSGSSSSDTSSSANSSSGSSYISNSSSCHDDGRSSSSTSSQNNSCSSITRSDRWGRWSWKPSRTEDQLQQREHAESLFYRLLRKGTGMRGREAAGSRDMKGGRPRFERRRRRYRTVSWKYKKSIGFFASFVFLCNQIIAPGLTSMPLTLMEYGWLPSLLVNLLFCILSTLCSVVLLRSVTLIEGNHNFDERYEYSATLRHFLAPLTTELPIGAASRQFTSAAVSAGRGLHAGASVINTEAGKNAATCLENKGERSVYHPFHLFRCLWRSTRCIAQRCPPQLSKKEQNVGVSLSAVSNNSDDLPVHALSTPAKEKTSTIAALSEIEASGERVVRTGPLSLACMYMWSLSKLLRRPVTTASGSQDGLDTFCKSSSSSNSNRKEISVSGSSAAVVEDSTCDKRNTEDGGSSCGISHPSSDSSSTRHSECGQSISSSSSREEPKATSPAAVRCMQGIEGGLPHFLLRRALCGMRVISEVPPSYHTQLRRHEQHSVAAQSSQQTTATHHQSSAAPVRKKNHASGGTNLSAWASGEGEYSFQPSLCGYSEQATNDRLSTDINAVVETATASSTRNNKLCPDDNDNVVQKTYSMTFGAAATSSLSSDVANDHVDSAPTGILHVSAIEGTCHSGAKRYQGDGLLQPCIRLIAAIAAWMWQSLTAVFSFLLCGMHWLHSLPRRGLQQLHAAIVRPPPLLPSSFPRLLSWLLHLNTFLSTCSAALLVAYCIDCFLLRVFSCSLFLPLLPTHVSSNRSALTGHQHNYNWMFYIAAVGHWIGAAAALSLQPFLALGSLAVALVDSLITVGSALTGAAGGAASALSSKLYTFDALYMSATIAASTQTFEELRRGSLLLLSRWSAQLIDFWDTATVSSQVGDWLLWTFVANTTVVFSFFAGVAEGFVQEGQIAAYYGIPRIPFVYVLPSQQHIEEVFSGVCSTNSTSVSCSGTQSSSAITSSMFGVFAPTSSSAAVHNPGGVVDNVSNASLGRASSAALSGLGHVSFSFFSGASETSVSQECVPQCVNHMGISVGYIITAAICLHLAAADLQENAKMQLLSFGAIIAAVLQVSCSAALMLLSPTTATGSVSPPAAATATLAGTATAAAAAATGEGLHSTTSGVSGGDFLFISTKNALQSVCNPSLRPLTCTTRDTTCRDPKTVANALSNNIRGVVAGPCAGRHKAAEGSSFECCADEPSGVLSAMFLRSERVTSLPFSSQSRLNAGVSSTSVGPTLTAATIVRATATHPAPSGRDTESGSHAHVRNIVDSEEALRVKSSWPSMIVRGSGMGALVSTFVDAYSYSNALPSWANELKDNIPVTQTLFMSTTFACTIYFLFGVLCAAAFPAFSASSNVLAAMLPSCHSLVAASCICFFHIFALLPNIVTSQISRRISAASFSMMRTYGDPPHSVGFSYIIVLCWCPVVLFVQQRKPPRYLLLLTWYDLLNMAICLDKPSAFYVASTMPWMLYWLLTFNPVFAVPSQLLTLVSNVLLNFAAPAVVYIYALHATAPPPRLNDSAVGSLMVIVSEAGEENRTKGTISTRYYYETATSRADFPAGATQATAEPWAYHSNAVHASGTIGLAEGDGSMFSLQHQLQEDLLMSEGHTATVLQGSNIFHKRALRRLGAPDSGSLGVQYMRLKTSEVETPETSASFPAGCCGGTAVSREASPRLPRVTSDVLMPPSPRRQHRGTQSTPPLSPSGSRVVRVSSDVFCPNASRSCDTETGRFARGIDVEMESSEWSPSTMRRAPGGIPCIGDVTMQAVPEEDSESEEEGISGAREDDVSFVEERNSGNMRGSAVPRLSLSHVKERQLSINDGSSLLPSACSSSVSMSRWSTSCYGERGAREGGGIGGGGATAAIVNTGKDDEEGFIGAFSVFKRTQSQKVIGFQSQKILGLPGMGTSMSNRLGAANETSGRQEEAMNLYEDPSLVQRRSTNLISSQDRNSEVFGKSGTRMGLTAAHADYKNSSGIAGEKLGNMRVAGAVAGGGGARSREVQRQLQAWLEEYSRQMPESEVAQLLQRQQREEQQEEKTRLQQREAEERKDLRKKVENQWRRQHIFHADEETSPSPSYGGGGSPSRACAVSVTPAELQSRSSSLPPSARVGDSASSEEDYPAPLVEEEKENSNASVSLSPPEEGEVTTSIRLRRSSRSLSCGRFSLLQQHEKTNAAVTSKAHEVDNRGLSRSTAEYSGQDTAADAPPFSSVATSNPVETKGEGKEDRKHVAMSEGWSPGLVAEATARRVSMLSLQNNFDGQDQLPRASYAGGRRGHVPAVRGGDDEHSRQEHQHSSLDRELGSLKRHDLGGERLTERLETSALESSDTLDGTVASPQTGNLTSSASSGRYRNTKNVNSINRGSGDESSRSHRVHSMAAEVAPSAVGTGEAISERSAAASHRSDPSKLRANADADHAASMQRSERRSSIEDTAFSQLEPPVCTAVAPASTNTQRGDGPPGPSVLVEADAPQHSRHYICQGRDLPKEDTQMTEAAPTTYVRRTGKKCPRIDSVSLALQQRRRLHLLKTNQQQVEQEQRDKQGQHTEEQRREEQQRMHNPQEPHDSDDQQQQQQRARPQQSTERQPEKQNATRRDESSAVADIEKKTQPCKRILVRRPTYISRGGGNGGGPTEGPVLPGNDSTPAATAAVMLVDDSGSAAAAIPTVDIAATVVAREEAQSTDEEKLRETGGELSSDIATSLSSKQRSSALETKITSDSERDCDKNGISQARSISKDTFVTTNERCASWTACRGLRMKHRIIAFDSHAEGVADDHGSGISQSKDHSVADAHDNAEDSAVEGAGEQHRLLTEEAPEEVLHGEALQQPATAVGLCERPCEVRTSTECVDGHGKEFQAVSDVSQRSRSLELSSSTVQFRAGTTASLDAFTDVRGQAAKGGIDLARSASQSDPAVADTAVESRAAVQVTELSIRRRSKIKIWCAPQNYREKASFENFRSRMCSSLSSVYCSIRSLWNVSWSRLFPRHVAGGAGEDGALIRQGQWQQQTTNGSQERVSFFPWLTTTEEQLVAAYALLAAVLYSAAAALADEMWTPLEPAWLYVWRQTGGLASLLWSLRFWPLLLLVVAPVADWLEATLSGGISAVQHLSHFCKEACVLDYAIPWRSAIVESMQSLTGWLAKVSSSAAGRHLEYHTADDLISDVPNSHLSASYTPQNPSRACYSVKSAARAPEAAAPVGQRECGAQAQMNARTALSTQALYHFMEGGDANSEQPRGLSAETFFIGLLLIVACALPLLCYTSSAKQGREGVALSRRRKNRGHAHS